MSRIAIPATVEPSPAASRPMLEAVGKKLGVVPNLFRLVSMRLSRGKARAMRRRSPLMQATATGAALALALPLAVRAESSAESASRTLNSEVRRDRARDEALDARAADKARSSTPAASPSARQIDEDRAAVGPDVGRPEEFGRSPQSLRGTGHGSNITR